eukprot:1492125-Amphidinium_carterae.1
MHPEPTCDHMDCLPPSASTLSNDGKICKPCRLTPRPRFPAHYDLNVPGLISYNTGAQTLHKEQ